MRIALIALFALAAASVSAAQDGRWTLVQSLGEVTVEEPGMSKIAIKPNARLNEGATVTTGPSGRAILTDGQSSITVNANSRIELPVAGDENATSIRQDFGKALFKVQKKPTAHFEVQTPYLAAVVKGTTFEVTVDAMGASVDVEEGLVDVGANMSGERVAVPGGQRIRVLRSGRFDGDRPADRGGERQTIAALNVIALEITPEADGKVAPEREFAALQPRFEAQSALENRNVDLDRDRDEGSPSTPPSAGQSDGGEVSAPPSDPVRAPPEPVESSNTGSGTSSSPASNSGDDDVDRRNYDKARWADFLAKLKLAYEDWKQRHGDGDDGKDNKKDKKE